MVTVKHMRFKYALNWGGRDGEREGRGELMHYGMSAT